MNSRKEAAAVRATVKETDSRKEAAAGMSTDTATEKATNSRKEAAAGRRIRMD